MRRTLADIVEDIQHSWKNIPIPARFYLEDLEAMTELEYLMMGHIVLIKEFLANADMWEGKTAELLKSELREIAA